MKNSKYWLIGFCAFCGLLTLAFGVNVLFKIKTDGIFSAEWNPGDALNYVGTMVGAISTFVLSLVAYKQNEKLQKLEDNNYIALNSCMVLIDSIYVKPKAHIPVNYDIHEGQMLKEKDNIDAYLSGYDIKVNMKKLNDSMQAKGALL